MNFGTIIYLGEKEQDNAYTVRQMLRNMEDSDNPSWWCSYIYEAICKEQLSEKIEQPDQTQEICNRMETFMRKQPNRKEVFVGSLNNQQDGITCPEHLENYIFNPIIKKEMWEWIRNYFLPYHKYDYDWFALLRFLADNEMLENGIEVTNDNFAKQISEWFKKSRVTGNSIKIYRTGYLGDTPYKIWNKEDFEKLQRSNQKKEGFIHLDRICNAHLTLANEKDNIKKILIQN